MIAAGTRLGPYEIVRALGAGGMGEVYRARDTKLGRDVALKILPTEFTHDPDRIARFKREAQVLASLNHPYIAAIYGLEEANDPQFLVLELVEGDTLAQRIARGPIPVEEALAIARQVAEALEAAHEKAIIHRDLKPSNIAFTKDERVKVLDFGLAKVLEPAPSAIDVSQSPTITTPAMMTGVGVILGTAAYMSPEQAKGRAADKRSDVWAFGCVLFEMLTGKRAFEGEDVSDTLAAVLKGEPDWNALPPDAPASVRTLMRRCLEKDRKRRIGDVSAALFLLNEPTILAPSTSVSPGAAIVPRPVLWRRVAAFMVVALGAGALVVATIWLATHPAAPRVSRLMMMTSGPTALTINGVDRDLAITPDGSRIVYVGNRGTQLFVRALGAIDPVPIATGIALRGPFVSPDGQWVAFFETGSTLKKVAITGGPSIPVAPLDGGSRGGTWLPDDTILVATVNPATGLQRVSANGGTPTVLTRPDHTHGEADHLWPEVLPGGRWVLFTITAAPTGLLDAAQVALLDLRTNTYTILVRVGSDAHYAASGHLVYTAAGTLRAVPFDLARLAVRGPAVPVVPRLVTTQVGAGDFAVAMDGTVVYVDAPDGVAVNGRTLVWVDRTGREEPIAAPPRLYVHPRLSPDDSQIALASVDQERDIYIWDLRRGVLRQFTFDPGSDQSPVWTPDSQRIVFMSQREGGAFNLWWQAADGTGTAERLTTSPNSQAPSSVSKDWQLVFNESTPTMGRDLLRLTLDGTRRVEPLLRTSSNEQNGVVSPDGHWLAYESDSTGSAEIYVRPFPNAAIGQRRVSTAGGTQPLWARDGKELFFLGVGGVLMHVQIDATATRWNNGEPSKLLEARYLGGFVGGDLGRGYDVSSDGRFLMMTTPGSDATATSASVIVVQHWDEELKRLVPTK